MSGSLRIRIQQMEQSKIIITERPWIKVQILQSSIPQLRIPTQTETNLQFVVERVLLIMLWLIIASTIVIKRYLTIINRISVLTESWP